MKAGVRERSARVGRLLAAAGLAALVTACAARLPMAGRMPMPQMPQMPDEAQIRQMVDRSMGKPALPEQPDPREIQVVFQTGHAAAITAVALSADGRHVLSSSGDETAKLWDLASGQAVRTFTGVDFLTRSAAFVGASQRVVIGGMLGVQMFDRESGRALQVLDGIGMQAVVSASGRFAARTRGFEAPLVGGRARPAAETGIRIVDLAGERTLVVLPADQFSQPVAISDDGGTVVVRRMEMDERRLKALAREGPQAMPDSRMEVWDVRTRKLVRELPAALATLTTTALSPDGRWFVAENFDRTLALYDTRTGELHASLVMQSGERWDTSNSLLFSVDGRKLAQATQGGHVRIWEMPAGRLVTQFAGTAVNFSADGSQVVAGRAAGGAPFVRDLADGTERSLAGGASAISDLALVGDGSAVVAATETAGAKLWNLQTGELLRTFACPGGASVHSVSVSSAARRVATGCQDGAAYLWNLDTGEQLHAYLQPMPGELGVMAIVRFDRTGRQLAVARNDELSVWNVAQHRELRRLKLPDARLSEFTDPQAMAASYENLPPAQRQAMKDISSDPTVLRAMQAVRALDFHPDGVRLAVAKGGEAALWDLETGQRVRQFSSAAAPPPQAPESPQQALMKKLMSGEKLSRKDMKELRAMQSGALGQPMVMGQMRELGDLGDLAEESLGLEDTRYLSFSADGRRLHTLGTTGERTWDVETGGRIRASPSAASAMDFSDPQAFLKQLENQEIGIGGGLAVSPDGRHGARGHGRIIKVWDLAMGRNVAELIGHTSDVTSLAYVRGGQLLVSGGRDGAVRVWSLAQGRELAQLIAFGGSDYVAVTPDQFYRISRRGAGGVAFRIGERVYPFEQFDLRFNRPDILLERLGRAPAAVVHGYRAAYQRRLRKLGFTEQMLGAELHLPEVQVAGSALPLTTEAASLTLQVRATDTKVPLDRLNVFVNDVPVFGTAGLRIADREAREHEQQIQVPLVAGRNKVQVSVLNQQGAESLRQTSYTTSTARFAAPDVYVVAIGVSRYQRSAYNLRFAAKDATDLTGAYRALAGRPGVAGQVHVLEITDARATRRGIREARQWLEQAGVNDLVVLFAAGHGMTDAASNYYFGTYDIDPEQPALAGLPYEEFEALLDGIPAMQKLMLIDTCFSGEIEQDEPVVVAQQSDTGGAGVVQMRAFKASRGVAVVADTGAGADSATAADSSAGALAAVATPADVVRFQQELFADLRRGTGAVVISSASGNEYALEGEQWANGVFTYALLDGLKNGSADANRDQIISVSELQAHVLEQVRRLTAGGQNPTVRRENLEYDFRVY